MTSEPLKQQPRIHLVEVAGAGSRKGSLRGWARVLVEEHLEAHIKGQVSGQWCAVECMARTMFGRNTPKNRKAVRKGLVRAFRDLLRSNRFLVIDYAPMKGKTHGEALACKIYDPKGAEDQRECSEHQLAKMLRRGQINADLLETARALLG
jgi:hypothetical protein